MAEGKVTDLPVVILAGGMGTRLKSVTGELPKPLVPVNGKPFIAYLLDYLSKCGFREAWLAVGYKAEHFSSVMGLEHHGVKLTYLHEEEPLGTGGALRQAALILGRPFLAVNGDTFFKADFDAMYRSFRKNRADMVICLKPMQHFDRYGIVRVDESLRVIGFDEKKPSISGLINAGIYLINSEVFEADLPVKFSFEKDLLEKKTGQLKLVGEVQDAYFMDIGIPEDYHTFCKDAAEGKLL